MLGVAQPAALQMSAIEAPCTIAQEDATPLVKCSLTPRGHGKSWAWYAKTISSSIQWASLCLERAFPFLGRGLRTKWESPDLNCRNESSTENACRSPILLTEANAMRSTVFNDIRLSSTDCRGSKGSCFKAVRTKGRSQEGTRWGHRGLNLLVPLRNLMTKSCFPTDLSSTASWCVAIAGTYTLRVEGDSLRSNSYWRKESMTMIGHLRGSSWW